MSLRPCTYCGKPTEANDGRHVTCRQTAFVEKFQELVESGLGWGQIMSSFGIKADSIERNLRRAQRPDLVLVWRTQVRDGGTFDTPGWLANERMHMASSLRKKVPA